MLRRPEPCLHHARRVLDLCAENGIVDPDLAFAHEALARAHAIAGHDDAARRHRSDAASSGRPSGAGVRNIRFHDLRHTFATLQLANNQPLKIVSEMMGHTRIAITPDLYTHVSAGMQRSAANALDDVLSSHV